MSSSIGALVVDLTANTGRFETDLGRAARASKKRAAEIEKDFARIGKAAVAFAAAAAVGLVALVKHSIDAADHLNKLSQSSGVSVENLSALAFAAKQSGVDLESLATGLKKLNVNIAEAAGNAKGEAAVAFKAMGISIRDAAGHTKSADQILGELAGKFAEYSDGANKTALAVQLFGKAGADLIPLLNAGSEGLKEFTEQAKKAGLVVSTETAQAAEEFNDKMSLLKATLFEGFGNRIASELLPTLNDLADEFLSTADGVDAMNEAAAVSGRILKGVVDFASGAAVAFKKLGNFIGGTAASLAQFAKGNFKESAEIIRQFNADNLDIEAKYQKARALLWKEGGDDVLREIHIHASQVKKEAPNIAGGKAVLDAVDKAVSKLKELKLELDAQVASFDLGEVALLRYRLTLGDLSDEVTKAGKEGKELTEKIIAQAEALQHLKDTKEITAALADVNSQILTLHGNLVAAAGADFDKQNAELVKTLMRDGNEEGQKQLATLRQLIVAQAEYNALNEKASGIESDLAREEERIRNSRDAGALTDIEMQRKLGDARKDAATQLAAIATAQQDLADKTGNPAIIENVKKLGSEIDNLTKQSDLLAQAIRNGFEDSFGNLLGDLISGTKSASDSFRDFLSDITNQITQMVAKNLAQKLFKSIFPVDETSGSGSAGGFFGMIAGALFGGGRATGGDVSAGTLYRINEKEPEFFRPDTGGKVIPLSKMGSRGGTHITQNINVSGRPDARTAQQLAIESARRQRIQTARLA